MNMWCAMNSPMEMARQIAIRREMNDACAKWVTAAFSACWQADGDFSRLAYFLRLPMGTRVAVARRNFFFIEVANELPGPNKAAALYGLVTAFMRSKWPSWKVSAIPPDDASDIEKALFYAADTGAPMNVSRRQIRNILTGSR